MPLDLGQIPIAFAVQKMYSPDSRLCKRTSEKEGSRFGLALWPLFLASSSSGAGLCPNRAPVALLSGGLDELPLELAASLISLTGWSPDGARSIMYALAVCGDCSHGFTIKQTVSVLCILVLILAWSSKSMLVPYFMQILTLDPAQLGLNRSQDPSTISRTTVCGQLLSTST